MVDDSEAGSRVGLPKERANLLTAQAISLRLAIPVQRVYDLARRGWLPTVRIGRQVRFDENQISRWVEAGGIALQQGAGVRASDSPATGPTIERPLTAYATGNRNTGNERRYAPSCGTEAASNVSATLHPEPQHSAQVTGAPRGNE